VVPTAAYDAEVEAAREEPVVAPPEPVEEVAAQAPSRLNPLRSLMFSLGLKNLDRMKRGEPKPEAAATAEPAKVEEPGAAAPVVEKVEVAEVEPTRAEPVRLELSPVELVREKLRRERLDRAVIVQSLPQFAEPVPVSVPQAVVEKPVEPVRAVTAAPEILPPKEFVPMREGEGAAEGNAGSEYGSDEVRTLPSRRGQYKRRS
jgi:hypothetical protein